MQIVAIPSVQEIVNTLCNMPGVSKQHEVVGCLVTIGRTEYSAARYVARNEHENKLVPDTRLYVCGAVPSSYLRSSRTHYVQRGSGREWYIACYVDHKTASNDFYKPFHPLGMWFGMQPWYDLGSHETHPIVHMSIQDMEV